MSHPMDDYLFERLLIDADRVVALAQLQKRISHPALKGRFRELLVDGILEPWLPATVHCATGTVISFRNSFRNKTQDDILLIDRAISPSVLMKPQVQEGVYMRNSVLARIEVKSTLDVSGFRGFAESCAEYRLLGLDLDNERAAAGRVRMMELNLLFAFESAVSPDTLRSWLQSTTDGSLSALCVLDSGFWKLTSEGLWAEYQCQTDRLAAERLGGFVGLISNTAFDQHLSAQGRDRLASLESGVGQHFNHWTPPQPHGTAEA